MIGDVFSQIYRRNAWNGIESLSGPGSGSAATARVAVDILRLVDELGVKTVLDAACGDSFWMPELPGYVGVDVAPEAIERARQRHPDRIYVVGNIVGMDMPPVDLVIFRDAMQHLPLRVGVAAIGALKAGGHRWLLASTYIGGRNVNIRAGECYTPDLTAPPFDLGSPARLIADGHDYFDPDVIRDPTKMLGLWAL